MKCTSCSRKVKPIGVVDIDGTLSDYHISLSDFCRRYWNLPVPDFPYATTEMWDGTGNYEDWIGITQEQYREAKLAYRQGGYKRVAPLQRGALEFMTALRFMDIELWIATTRPWSRLDNVDPDTKFWLARHKIKYDHLLFNDMKYQQLAEIVEPDRVVFVVDDLPEQLAHAATFLPGALRFQVERPHNRGTSGNGRKGTLSEIENWARRAVMDWIVKHGN